MIRIQSLSIEEFRGIHRLKIDFGGRNYAVCGPNGTGKSGVVDALEFAMTGSITRLTGQGTSGITVKAHAPHVDQRDRPDKARVVLTATIPSLKNKTATIERKVSAAGAPLVQPQDADVDAVVAELAVHPEFALSRREIIKYVLAPPGERSKEIQALLRLDRIERVRQSLQTVLNTCNTENKRATIDVTEAQGKLVRALGTAGLKREEILAAVNQRRGVLHLEPLVDLQRDTSLKAGVAAPEGKPAPQRVRKKQAITDIAALTDVIAAPESAQIAEARAAVATILRKLAESPSLLRSLKQEGFLESGLELIEGELCPFCDTAWNPEELRLRISQKLSEASAAQDLRKSLEDAAEPIASALTEIGALLAVVAAYGPLLSPAVDTKALTHWVAALKARRETLTDIKAVETTLTTLSTEMRQTPAVATETLAALSQAVQALPDASQEDEAKEYLTVCQERLDVYREAKRRQTRAAAHAELAGKVLAAYSESSNTVLTAIYHKVEQDFTKYYRIINRDDEATFEGKLTPSLGKLGFEVDFYGRGFFPPGAYHSEGHQDGMGLCLYLALMKHTLGAQFTFAVLDDVLMSVDSGHRREVCALLKNEFPDTQFIFTTHDSIWLQFMKTEQIITSKSCVHFRKWTVEDGPLVWDDKEVWKEIEDDLERGDVPGAAGALRRFLEYSASQLSGRLRASIEFRGDAQYDFGELMPSAIAIWRDLLARAQEAAQSWGKRDEAVRISGLQREFGTRVARSQVEQWVINRSIHYNEWANLQKEEFRCVVEAFRLLLESFQCAACTSYVYVTPPKGTREGVRCDCGTFALNLKKKSS